MKVILCTEDDQEVAKLDMPCLPPDHSTFTLSDLRVYTVMGWSTDFEVSDAGEVVANVFVRLRG